MQKIYCLLGLLIILVSNVHGQDEGKISKRERIALSSNLYLGGGMSFTFGDNIGDYSRGYNVEVGYLKRLNRVLSIGGGLSYQTFKYDPDKTGTNNAFRGDQYVDDDGYDAIPALYIQFEGGDIKMTSASFTIKLNFVPVKDDSKFSVYAFAKPFVSMVNRTEVTGDALYFEIQDLDDDGNFTKEELIEAAFNNSYAFEWNAESSDYPVSKDLKKDTDVTGGIFIGPGIEMNPGKGFSISLQASIGYTFPVSLVSTEKYKHLTVEDFASENQKFPMTKEGFPSLNLQLGFSYNF
jgi:hypothetical protein